MESLENDKNFVPWSLRFLIHGSLFWFSWKPSSRINQKINLETKLLQSINIEIRGS